ncbi:M56 family metallopeptidase [Pedobacter nototheniae]|uniref:M56 family metallopeptidase n=1 Tax=Pedobacter nototheniae TaxID=2488994 RepID=UPI00103AA250|nr:M56 family metallopeptidase [Pedobacter nototheniae]
MPHFFILLFKINLVLILFAATYYLVLRRLTFYAINRMFLMFGILFSSLYPFINLTEFFGKYQSVQALVPKFTQNVNRFVQQDAVPFYWQLLVVLFYVGVVVMALRLAFQFISLRRMHNNSVPGNVEQHSVRILSDKVSPFSFWQTIYVNPLIHKKEDLQNILEHEKVHVEELHTLDIILAEICVVFYWFNPGVWLMKKAVRENIEFITDAKILKRGIDKRTYQYSLLDVSTLEPSVAIVNNFNLSDLKKRIKMMNTKKSSSLNLTRYLLAIPILAITLAFTINKKEIQKKLVPLSKFVNQVLPDTKVRPEKETIAIQKIITKRKKSLDIKPVEKDSLKKIVLFMHQTFNFTDSTDKVLKVILNNFENKANELPANGTKKTNFSSSYTFTDSATNEKKTFIKNITIVAHKGTGEKKENSYNFKTFSTTGDVKISVDSTAKVKNVIYFVNGKKLTKEEFMKLSPNTISSISIKPDSDVKIIAKQN